MISAQGQLGRTSDNRLLSGVLRSQRGKDSPGVCRGEPPRLPWPGPRGARAAAPHASADKQPQQQFHHITGPLLATSSQIAISPNTAARTTKVAVQFHEVVAGDGSSDCATGTGTGVAETSATTERT